MHNVYLDSSVVLRHVLGEPQPFPLPGRYRKAWASELLRIECLRTIDCERIHSRWSSEEVTLRMGILTATLALVEEISLQAPILRRAAESFPTVVRTLDAIHLATAILMQEQLKEQWVFLTHDRRQGIAATAAGLTVEGF